VTASSSPRMPSQTFVLGSYSSRKAAAWWLCTLPPHVWPELRLRQRTQAVRPPAHPAQFGFIGLAFLVAAAVSADLPPAFARAAACGDMMR